MKARGQRPEKGNTTYRPEKPVCVNVSRTVRFRQNPPRPLPAPGVQRDNLLLHSFYLDDLCSALGRLSNILIDAPSLVLCSADFILE
jgi:hypothetical protein